MKAVLFQRARNEVRSAVVMFILAACAVGQTFDSVADGFSDTANPSGPWSFGSTPTLGGTFTLFPTTTSPCAGGTEWTGGGAGSSLVGRGTAAMSWTCGTTALPAAEIVMIPGLAGERAVARFKVYSPGPYTVGVLTERIDSAGATTTDLKVLFNGTQVGAVVVSALGAPQYIGPFFTAAVGDIIDVSVGDCGDGAAGDAVGVAIWIESSCGVPAMYQVVGLGCPGAGAPFLYAFPPILGMTETLHFDNSAPPSASGFVFGSLPTTQTIPAFGCTVYVDLASLFVVAPIATDAGGSWSASFFLPDDAALYGVQFMLQAALIGGGANPTITLSEGLLGTFGCSST